MNPIVRPGRSLSFSQKLSRLAERLRQPMWQKYGATVLAGKLAGVGLTLLVMAGITGIFFAKVYAADTPMKAADIVNPVNTAWTLIAAFLVFGM
jgi:ammonium transporter, Amt family